MRSATEPSRQHKDVAAACGAVMLRFHGVFNLCEVLICGYLHLLCHGPVWAINPRCAFRCFGRKFRKGDCLGLCTFVLIYSSMSILVLRCTTLSIFWKGRVCESMLCYLLVIIIAKLVIQCLNPMDLRYLFTRFVAFKLFYVRFFMFIEYIVIAWCMTDYGHNSAEYRFFWQFLSSLSYSLI